ncbi:GIY-YIG nuclease family protein [Sphingomonas gilva]|uniref:GIY-YIG nuclease family protein n=1 Tax=Sphingomonas gilva TaxID=2305907 RepID=A0A396RUB8_9SPHN|nr:GIY-YIG nuclease family protein [Sphingomonas gilva]RHW17291.1 GIY-YIG nuclease family protein [Sphingomonas gilva]
MAFWVYLLRCSDGRYYTDHTDDLERRFAQHQTGGFCDFTSRRRPVTLAWSEYFQTRIEAREAERIVGGWSRAKKEALIRGDWGTVSFFARPPKERFSTSLETNGAKEAEAQHLPPQPTPFVSSEVEKRNPTR